MAPRRSAAGATWHRHRPWPGLLLALLVAAWPGSPTPAGAQTGNPQTGNAQTSQADARSRCLALRTADFTQIADAPAQLQTVVVASLGPNQPEVCRADGYVAPNTGFTLVLPLQDWNGKYLQGGCGGACGSAAPWWCNDAVQRGYACLGQDMGHRSTTADWLWAHDDLARRAEFGYRSTHATAVAGKAIAAAYLGRAPAHAYFMGCSTGGRQAHVLAQRFPGDFDGIVAGAAPHNEVGSGLQLAWTVRANLDGDPAKAASYILQEPQARLLHSAVVQACDMNDGLKDGLIGDPRRCRFDPGTLACKAGGADDTGDAGASCLNPAQVGAARKMYAGPTDAAGRPIGTQGGVMPGSELNWIGDYMPRGERLPQYVAFMTSFFRHAGFDPSPPATWQLSDLDFTRDRDRMAAAEFIYNAQNPDLREFKQRGGKMIGFQGWGDTSVVPLGTLDYYDTVTRTMGGLDKTRDFYRLYMVPGMRHCSGDGSGGDVIDFLAALEAWVEAGRAPDALVGRNVDWRGPITSFPIFPVPAAQVRLTRVHYPYPDEARYAGPGDPDDPANWRKVRGLPQPLP